MHHLGQRTGQIELARAGIHRLTKRKWGVAVQSVKAALVVSLALAAGLGTWYLRAWVPDRSWRALDDAGCKSLDQERFGEAERHFSLAVETARGFADPDRRLAVSLFHLAQSLAGQSRETEALPLLDRAMAIHARTLGRDNADGLRMGKFRETLLRQMAGAAEAGAWQRQDAEIVPVFVDGRQAPRC